MKVLSLQGGGKAIGELKPNNARRLGIDDHKACGIKSFFHVLGNGNSFLMRWRFAKPGVCFAVGYDKNQWACGRRFAKDLLQHFRGSGQPGRQWRTATDRQFGK